MKVRQLPQWSVPMEAAHRNRSKMQLIRIKQPIRTSSSQKSRIKLPREEFEKRVGGIRLSLMAHTNSLTKCSRCRRMRSTIRGDLCEYCFFMSRFFSDRYQGVRVPEWLIRCCTNSGFHIPKYDSNM